MVGGFGMPGMLAGFAMILLRPSTERPLRGPPTDHDLWTTGGGGGASSARYTPRGVMMRTRPQPPLTPLAVAVLELLHERDMHPYEMQQLIRDRGTDHVIK